ncbi:MAG: alpha-hydroxy acid oxidase [Paracoccaceae bacterium]
MVRDLTPLRDPIPADCLSLADYERHALARMTPGTRAYIQGAGADGITREANLAAWAGLRLLGRGLADMVGAHTRLSLVGCALDHPILLAPCAWHGLVNPGGECETALGAAATGTLMTVSTQAGQSLEAIAETPGPKWFQLYFQLRREDTLALVRRAEAAGCLALVVTVDAAVNGIRNDEQRAGFALPPGLSPVNLRGFAQPVSRAAPGESPVFRGLLDHAPGWADLDWLRAETRLPLLLKGVMHPEDVERALAAGIDGLIVSNHGGRVLDTLPATADILPRVVAQVAGRVPILCDGGIRRGTDVLKALALGASAVLIGRPQLHALAVGGAPGVAHMLTILRAELEVAMALTGCRTLDAIGPGVLWA